MERDKSSRTITAGQLIAQLAKLDPNTPVVMQQNDEPMGTYGVRSIDVREMQRDPTFAEGSWGTDVYHDYEARYPEIRWNNRYELPMQVAFLGDQLPYQPTIDAEVEQPAIEPGRLT